MRGEFEIIREFFTQPFHEGRDESVHLGIGDDAALLAVPEGHELVVTTDSLVAGRHFLESAAAYDIGWKSLAVNLSDLAAMSAEPRWVTLAITLPASDENFLREFSRGFFDLAKKSKIALVGGDTTKGPLSITVTAMGIVPTGQALKRSAAKIGDDIYVSGPVGDAGLGLRLVLDQWMDELSKEHADYVLQRLNRPEPRTEFGRKLRGIASACMDVSDGLAQDLGHLLNASNVGAELYLERLPRSAALVSLDSAFADVLALTSGDDYELLFTVSPDKKSQLPENVHCIGCITEEKSLRFMRNGQAMEMPVAGFQHF